MLKRGGRAYDQTGVDGMSPGELAVRCPACPIPSVNLPPNWKSAGKETEYVDPLYLVLPINISIQVSLLLDPRHQRLLPVQEATSLEL